MIYIQLAVLQLEIILLLLNIYVYNYIVKILLLLIGFILWKIRQKKILKQPPKEKK